MTGWRIGWISAPPEIGHVLENLVQYSTSGVPEFSQRAACAALRQGEDFIQLQRQRARLNRDVVCQGLITTGKVQLAIPQGAFYLFFKVDGYRNSRQLAFDLVEEAGVGLAPGAGFYSSDPSFLRLCYLRDPDQIEQAVERLVSWINRR